MCSACGGTDGQHDLAAFEQRGEFVDGFEVGLTGPVLRGVASAGGAPQDSVAVGGDLCADGGAHLAGVE